MHILVCLKQVPDTEARLQIAGGSVQVDGGASIIDPYAELALEQALQVKDQTGASVTAVTVGGGTAVEVLQRALGMGATGAVLVEDPALEGSDAAGIARVLAAVVRRENPDIVFCGQRSYDDQAAQLGPYLAELLGWAQVTAAAWLNVKEGAPAATVRRESEAGMEIIEVQLPCVLAWHKSFEPDSPETSLNPRYPTLPMLMKAKRTQIPRLTALELGVAGEAGAGAARVRRVDLRAAPGRPEARILKGDPADATRELVRLLHEEAKVL
jgi:electron transfer flavoprotein beta subunit